MYLPDFGDPLIVSVYLGALIVAASVWFGGQPERWGFAILALMLVIQLTLHTLIGAPEFNAVEMPVAIADLFGLVAFVMLMRSAERVWPIFAVAMMLFSLLGHFARLTGDILPFSYANFESVPTVLILVSLPIAVLAHQWRLRRQGIDQDWTPIRTDKALRKAAKRVALQKN